MLQPKSELPWKLELEELRNNEFFLLNGMYDGSAFFCNIEDSQYVVQACNNFPEAIGLLNESKSFKRIADYEKWIKKVEEFLKSLEENGE